MGDRATITILDGHGGTLATLYTHNGGSDCWMLPKLADWCLSGSGTAANRQPADFVRYALSRPVLKLELTSREHGDDETHYRLAPGSDGPIVGVRTRDLHTGTWGPTRIIHGTHALLAAAADALIGMADRADQYAAQNGWTAETTARLGYDTSAARRRAARYIEQATDLVLTAA